MGVSYQQIRYDVADAIATITLDRSDKLNAYTVEMGDEVVDAFRAAQADDAVRAIVLTGAGRAFCAGVDLDALKAHQAEGGEAKSRLGQEEFLTSLPLEIVESDKPVLAAINGHAIGVGLTMTMQCDLRFVAEDAKLAFAFVRRGIIPELASHSILPRVVGLSNAADLLLSGRTFRGREAAEMGLASRALPADEVLPAALAWAREVAVNAAPASVAIAKRLMWEGVTESPIETMRKETPLFAWVGRQKDAVEGVKSFLEKRAPEFTLRPSRDLPDWPGEESGT